MFERRRARVLLAVLTLVALVLLTVDARAGRSGPLARVRDGIATVFGPVQDGLATVLSPLGRALDNVGDLFRLREENVRLEERLEELEQRRESFADLQRENEELRALLEMRDTLLERDEAFEFLPAEVIALAPSNFEWTITLDVGTRHGVEIDMTVINGDGLVGRVIQVTPTASRVLLAIDPNFAAAARIARSGENGVIEGADTDPMRLTLFNPEADAEERDEVVTSTYQNATYPDGIPIGAVAAIGEPIAGESRQVTVRPYVDFTRLGAVLVILREPPPAPLPPPPTATGTTRGPTPAPTVTEDES